MKQLAAALEPRQVTPTSPTRVHGLVYIIQGSLSRCGWLEIPGVFQVDTGNNTLKKSGQKTISHKSKPARTIDQSRRAHRAAYRTLGSIDRIKTHPVACAHATQRPPNSKGVVILSASLDILVKLSVHLDLPQ